MLGVRVVPLERTELRLSNDYLLRLHAMDITSIPHGSGHYIFSFLMLFTTSTLCFACSLCRL